MVNIEREVVKALKIKAKASRVNVADLGTAIIKAWIEKPFPVGVVKKERQIVRTISVVTIG